MVTKENSSSFRNLMTGIFFGNANGLSSFQRDIDAVVFSSGRRGELNRPLAAAQFWLAFWKGLNHMTVEHFFD